MKRPLKKKLQKNGHRMERPQNGEATEKRGYRKNGHRMKRPQKKRLQK
jgi:hypothetical protein